MNKFTAYQIEEIICFIRIVADMYNLKNNSGYLTR